MDGTAIRITDARFVVAVATNVTGAPTCNEPNVIPSNEPPSNL
jgi:hypothetical protein